MARQLKSGQGWQIGWDPEAPLYRGLVGTEAWALELTEEELDDFCRLATQLADTLAQIASELMDEERITCEVESDRIWMEAEGFPHSFSLRFILLQGRRGEGYWDAEAVTGLIQAMQSLQVF
ncbi:MULTISPECIES: DUF1818 family protein [unclassified Leptolyngbya]|uniref:DUF1818 family protein n=1 Tax=unclassified Leptolyngbya TaxID=2650499 RepID=UPI001686AC99|nr:MULTISPECIES: DUF1818 family protein [unclassified Leptolyngbya]MBD1912761.1 DUF1818 family protein [Leptolyngbya sp. FACHB-8]MBD2157708.1 DUF1818 family protein [Leptolyngbya sp. FACHB-16]